MRVCFVPVTRSDLGGWHELVAVAPEGDEPAGVRGVGLDPSPDTVDALLDLLVGDKLLTPGSG